LKNSEIEGIKCLGGDLIDFATRRNNQPLLDIMFQTISSLDKKPHARYADCLRHMGTLLHQAVALRQMSEIKKLVSEQKIDVNSKTTYSLQTPLAFACHYGHSEVVEFLLANNADVNQRYGMVEHYSLQEALENQHFAIAKLLVNKGANIFFSTGSSFLFSYCLDNKIESVKFLLEHTDARLYIDREEPRWNNESPMSIAYKKQYQELISLLNEYRKLEIKEKKQISDEKNLNSEHKPTVVNQQTGETEQILLNEASWLLLKKINNRSFKPFSNKRHEPNSKVFNRPTQQRSNERQLNSWEIEALEKLQSHGLPAQMLLNRNENRHEFNDHHCYALRNLVEDRNFSIDNALAEIDGLSIQQAMQIRNGETREQILADTARSLRPSYLSFNI
jgi:hypothetical protein